MEDKKPDVKKKNEPMRILAMEEETLRIPDQNAEVILHASSIQNPLEDAKHHDAMDRFAKSLESIELSINDVLDVTGSDEF